MPNFQIVSMDSTALSMDDSLCTALFKCDDSLQITDGWFMDNEQTLSSALSIVPPSSKGAPVVFTPTEQYQIVWQKCNDEGHYVILAKDMSTESMCSDKDVHLWSGMAAKGDFKLVVSAIGGVSLVLQ